MVQPRRPAGFVLVYTTLLALYPAVDPVTGAMVQSAIVSTLPLNLISVGAALLLPLIASYFMILYSAFSGPAQPAERY